MIQPLRFLSFFLLSLLLFPLIHQATGQGIILPTSGSYTQTFDNLANGLPEGWTVRTGATTSPPSSGTAVNLSTTPVAWSEGTTGFQNVASADGLSPTASASEQAASSDRALGVRQADGTSYRNVAFTLQLANTIGVSNMNLTFKIQGLDVAANYGTTWQVEYGLGQTPRVYWPVGAAFTTRGATFSNQIITKNLDLSNNSGPIWLRIVANVPASGYQQLAAIDDVTLTYSTQPQFNFNYLQNALTYAAGAGPATEDLSFQAYNLPNNPSTITFTTQYPFTISADGTNFGSTATVPYTGSPFSSSIKVRLQAGLSSVGAYSGVIWTSATGNNLGTIVRGMVTQTANQPTIATIPSILTGTGGFLNYVGFNESVKNVELVGANLSTPGSYTVTSSNPAAFQLYDSSRQIRSSQAVYSYDVAHPASRLMQVSFIEGLSAGEYTGSLLIKGGGASPITLPLSGTVLTNDNPPVISVDPSTLIAFSTTLGLPSVPQTFTLTGRNFNTRSEIRFDLPAGFEIALPPYISYNSGTISPSFPPGDFTLSILVRMTGRGLGGTYGGDIIMTNIDGSRAKVSVTGTVHPADTQPLSVTVANYNCQTGAITFGRVGGDASRPVEYMAVGIKSYSTDPYGVIDAAKRNDPNSGTVVTLKARYVNDPSSEVSFNFDFGTYCNQPPSGGSFAITGVNTVDCQSVTAYEKRIVFTPAYSGLTGSPVSFSIVNELLPTTLNGPYTLRVYTDNPVITLKATQTGSPNEATYAYNWLNACAARSGRLGVVEQKSELQVQVLGNPVAGKAADIIISGITGQAVQLSLFDAQGRVLHQQSIQHVSEKEKISIPLNANKGLFILQIKTGNEHQKVKLIKL